MRTIDVSFEKVTLSRVNNLDLLVKDAIQGGATIRVKGNVKTPGHGESEHHTCEEIISAWPAQIQALDTTAMKKAVANVGDEVTESGVTAFRTIRLRFNLTITPAVPTSVPQQVGESISVPLKAPYYVVDSDPRTTAWLEGGLLHYRTYAPIAPGSRRAAYYLDWTLTTTPHEPLPDLCSVATLGVPVGRNECTPVVAGNAELRVSAKTACLRRTNGGLGNLDRALTGQNYQPNETVGAWRTNILKLDMQPYSTPVTGATDNRGDSSTHLNSSNLPDGYHILELKPTDAVRVSNDPVGPELLQALEPASTPASSIPNRVYRPLHIVIRTIGGRLSASEDPLVRPGIVKDGTVDLTHGHVWSGDTSSLEWNRADPGHRQHVFVDTKPIWWQLPHDYNHAHRPVNDIDVIVVHYTAATVLNFLRRWESPGTTKSINYAVDRDGHVVKCMRDTRHANHAGVSRWQGVTTGTGPRSIGIEIVHEGDTGEYTPEQFDSVADLLERLLDRYRSQVSHNVIGHSDIGVSGTQRLGRKPDPGIKFEWLRYEARGIGLLLDGARPGDPAPFGWVSNITANQTDAALTGTPISQIKTDLKAIGYQVHADAGNVNGSFDGHAQQAVNMFRKHFHEYCGTAGTVVNEVTARTIRRVREALTKPSRRDDFARRARDEWRSANGQSLP